MFKYGQCRPGNCAARQLLPAPRRSPNKFAEPSQSSHSRLRCYQFMNISTNVTNIKVLRSSRMEPGTNVFAPGLLTSLHALRRCHHLHNRDWSGQTTWLTSPPLATLSTFTRDECWLTEDFPRGKRRGRQEVREEDGGSRTQEGGIQSLGTEVR